MTVEIFPYMLFVKGSARLLADTIFVTVTSPLLSNNRIRWYLRSMCLLFLCTLSFFELATTLLLSQYSVYDCAEATTPKSNRKFLSQTAALAASEVVTYSTFMVESVMQYCFTLLELMAPPPRVNSNSKVDFLVSLFDWKFESVYQRDTLNSLTAIPTYGL